MVSAPFLRYHESRTIINEVDRIVSLERQLAVYLRFKIERLILEQYTAGKDDR